MQKTGKKPFERVYEIVSRIPKGRVMTYKSVAALADVNPRVVGFAMRSNKDTQRVPCHRVIKSDGTLAGYAMGGTKVKRKILEAEGITFNKDDAVDLQKYIYSPRTY